MSLYNDAVYSLGKGNRLGSLGETKVQEKKKGLLTKVKEIDDKYKEHGISISKEEDRLVFKGQFKRGTDVNLVLYRNFSSVIYDVQISKKPYTALCVDVFTEEENEKGINITKYINSEGLSGSYSIYVEIDGELYNTGLYTDF